jgi:hypothetical protein
MMNQPQFVYAVIRDDGSPVLATTHREHAFEECRSRAGVPVSFSAWHEGVTSTVTHNGEVRYRIHCLELHS